MLKRLVFFILLIANTFILPQSFNTEIDDIINKTNLDSLITFVRILSGEDSVKIGDSTTVIKSRSNSTGNESAGDYILEKLANYGLYTSEEFFRDNEGRNILAYQEGTEFPDSNIIICAHYDSVTDYCADDNASGTAAVLEAARIISEYETRYTVIYALWDMEEWGLVGSRAYAYAADSTGTIIKGVVNLDMISYDSDSNFASEVHMRDIANCGKLAEYAVAIDSIYSLPLEPTIINPGASNSDNGAFWIFDYSAILLSELYRGGDFNQYYHSAQDRIDKFNLEYYHNMAKLAIGTTASLALENIIVSTDNIQSVPVSFKLANYPNPFNPATTITYSLPEAADVKLAIYNSLGQHVRTVSEGYRSIGTHSVLFDGRDLASGVYFCSLFTGSNVNTIKLILLR